MSIRIRLGIAAWVVAVATGLLTPTTTDAYETDQYTDRLGELEDSVELLNREMNRALAEIATAWQRGARPGAFATRVYKKVGGRHWVDKIERWAARSPEVARIEQAKRTSIYGGIPFWSTRVLLVGLGKTINVNDVLVGTDKLGHFISQGWKYYKRHRRGDVEEKVVRLGLRNEKGIFGAATTGVFSNADLVANYEGYLFFRSLFEDDVIPGRPAIIRWEGKGAVVQRPFDWRDHINDYWDEALNPNRYSRRLGKHVAHNLERLCDDFERDPSEFTPTDESALLARYAHLGLRESSDYRLDRVCVASSPAR